MGRLLLTATIIVATFLLEGKLRLGKHSLKVTQLQVAGKPGSP